MILDTEKISSNLFWFSMLNKQNTMNSFPIQKEKKFGIPILTPEFIKERQAQSWGE